MNSLLSEEPELSSLDWSALIHGDSLIHQGAEPRNLIEAALHNAEDYTIRLTPAQLKRLDARSFIRLVRDLAAEYATYRAAFEARGRELALAFRHGSVEFRVVFMPTIRQPGDLVVSSRLVDWREGDASVAGLGHWMCLRYAHLHGFYLEAEQKWSLHRYSRFCESFISNFLNFTPYTRGESRDYYYFSCTQVQV